MMKRIAVIISILILVLSACEIADHKKGGEIKAYGIANAAVSGDSGINVLADEYAPWSDDRVIPHKDALVDLQKTIEFEGRTYTGTYRSSAINLLSNYQTDTYDFEGGWFSIKNTDGSLLEFGSYKINPGDKRLEDCKTKAKALAEQFIDTDKYELSMETDESSVNVFRFTKAYEACKSCANLSIVYSGAGDVILFSRMMTEEMRAVAKTNPNYETILNKLCSAEGEKAVDEKIRELYPDLSEYAIKDKYAVVLDSGELGVANIVNIVKRVQDTANSDGYNQSSMRMIVLITEK